MNMSLAGLTLCSRYAYPPNALHLCGPEKQTDLSWYVQTEKPDRGTAEILAQFSTLYPYLCLIAGENGLKDPFDKEVVQAYWLGNQLLSNVGVTPFVNYLKDTLHLKRHLPRRLLSTILAKLPAGAVPHHAFHVLNVYHRTGHIATPHTLETMDACLINWGKVVSVGNGSIVVKTQKLTTQGNKLVFDHPITRSITYFGKRKEINSNLQVDDIVSYHWGKFCERLTSPKLQSLSFYTKLALNLANTSNPL